MKILVIGESCLDVFKYGKVERLEPSAPVPVFSLQDSRENCGMARNVFNNLLALGIEAEIFSNENWKNITKTRFVEKKSNHMFMRVDENDDQFAPCDITKLTPEILGRYDAIIVSDYDKGFLSKKDIQYIYSFHNVVFLDTKKPLGDWAHSAAAYIKINSFEFKKSNKINRSLRDKLIVTLGSEGAAHKDITYRVPMVEIKDLSGAGDTFISALAVKYVESRDIAEAIRFANDCATKVVQKRGVSSI